ncbi:hypothetical protein ABPG77_010172 [Micractinium sp. CCAP 211/92]
MGLRSSLLLLGLALVAQALYPLQFSRAASPGRLLKELDANAAQLAAGVNAFGSAVFDQLADQAPPGEADGLLLSPFSLAQALAMLANGAEPGGESYKQVLGALGASGMDLEEFNSMFSELTADLLQPPPSVGGNKPGLRVDVANSGWLKQGLEWQPEYAATLAAYYNATLDTLTSAKEVNDWVSEKTQGKITSIVDDATVREAVLLLVNAIYFKGSWASQFMREATEPQPFTLVDGSKQQAPMMRQQLEFGGEVASLTAEVEGSEVTCEAVKLPFEGRTFTGIFAMPAGSVSEVAGDLALEAGNSSVPYAAALSACRSALSSALVPAGSDASVFEDVDNPINLYVPRFEIEFTAGLNKALQALNVTAPFTEGDLTQIAQDADGNPVTNLDVSSVLQKVYEKIDETGAEAAAATAVIVGTSAPGGPVKEPLEFKFDRPFIFEIVHEASGLELFTGEVYVPEKADASA